MKERCKVWLASRKIVSSLKINVEAVGGSCSLEAAGNLAVNEEVAARSFNPQRLTGKLPSMFCFPGNLGNCRKEGKLSGKEVLRKGHKKLLSPLVMELWPLAAPVCCLSNGMLLISLVIATPLKEQLASPHSMLPYCCPSLICSTNVV